MLNRIIFGLCAILWFAAGPPVPAQTPAQEDAAASDRPASWQILAPGVDARALTVPLPSTDTEATIRVFRIDPALWTLELLGLNQTGDTSGKTARQWARDHDFAIVTNAGMFATDYSTHVGHMSVGKEINNARVNDYESVAAFGPRNPEEDPPFRIFDLDDPSVTFDDIRDRYTSIVQNLRLIKRPGENRWPQAPKKWTEVALGEDGAGNVLLLYSRHPFTMHDFNRALLSADIDIVAAQHLEGGPEAQIYVQLGETELEMVGSFETGFNENDDNRIGWPIPNVIGVRKR